MKKAWPNQPIGAICEVVNGGTPKTGVAEYWGGEHQWITPAEMGKRSSPFVSGTERTLTDLGLANSSASPMTPYSVILSSRAPIGHLVINTVPMATNQGCKGLVPGKGIHHKFLYYYLGSIVDLLNALGTGATFRELSGGKLKEVTIPVPPLPEQQRIIGILDEAFEGIATAKANAEKNLQNARALFESHLQSVFTQRGPGWVARPLGDVCDLLNGFAFKSGDAVQESHTQLVRMGNLYGNRLNLDRSPVFYPDSFAVDYKRYRLNEGDLIMSLTGTTGKEDYGYAVRIPECGHSLLMNQRIAKFDSLKVELVDQDFLFYYLRSRAFLDILYPTANGTRQANLSSVTIKTLPIPLCPVEKQRAIASALDGVNEEAHRLAALYERKLAALEALKKSLLHQAFTGQL
jgi:type I restriction enzyme S subunit